MPEDEKTGEGWRVTVIGPPADFLAMVKKSYVEKRLPRVSEGRHKDRFPVDPPRNMLAKIDKAAERLGVTRNDLVVQAIREYLRFLDYYFKGQEKEAKAGE